ncbi:MAG: endo-1,4-beta-xylanase [Ktedonobacterales bacterium]
MLMLALPASLLLAACGGSTSASQPPLPRGTVGPLPPQTACADPSGIPQTRFGVDINVAQVGLANFGPLLDQAATLGVGWVRAGFSWKQIEPQPGQWDYTQPDAIVAQAQAHHLHLLIGLGNTPQWALADPSAVAAGQDGPPADPAAFGAFAAAMATRYRGTVCAWRVYNEPWNTNKSWRGGTPAQYAATLAAAYTAIHSAAAEDLVMPGGVNCTFNPTDQQAQRNNATFQQLLTDPKYPMDRYMDIEDIHIGHSTVAMARDKINCTQQALTHYGGAKRVWVTEFGYSSDPSTQPLAAYRNGADAQAQYIRDVAPGVLALTGVAKIFWVYLTDNPTAAVPLERSQGLIAADGTPKPAFTAYQHVIAQSSAPGS